ncbi:MAG TPA: hypothetical protein VF533_21775 [Solirubrobacteraceae bacterium]|jgi:hypothetical protein
MALQLPHRTPLRRAAMTAALGAAMLAPVASPASAAKHAKRSKLPVVTSVAPMQSAVGDTLTVRGRNFRRGRDRNTVIFQRAGGKAVFVKAGLATRKMLKVALADKLQKQLLRRGGEPVPTVFRIRVLAARFGKRFTLDAGSPTIGPKPAAPVAAPTVAPGVDAAPAPAATPQPVPTPFNAAGPDGDCDGDNVLNRAEADDDADLMPDALEADVNKRLDDADIVGGRMNACNADSDGDAVPDGYEYRSARDLNDSEYQDPNAYLPAPEKRMYPNPLNPDAAIDYDGDSLTLDQEYRLHRLLLRDAKTDLATLTLDTPLGYSDGMQYSIFKRDARGVRRPALPAAGYAKAVDFLNWAVSSGNDPVFIEGEKVPLRLFDFDRDHVLSPSETLNFDDGDGWLSDDERDEDADGLNNFEETRGRMDASWWKARYENERPYAIVYSPTDVADADTDGDGIRDGADDQDFDDIPNLMELSREKATGLPSDKKDAKKDDLTPRPVFGRVNPFNPCLPDEHSRTCPRYVPFTEPWAPFDDSIDYLILN